MSDPQTAICRQVYARFAALRGVKPTVQAAGPNRVYTFQKRLPAAEGRLVQQVVRVTVAPDGRVLKMVASR